VLENEAKAHIFLAICDPAHCRAWLHWQINVQHSSNNS
jgi:hypothetical protein